MGSRTTGVEEEGEATSAAAEVISVEATTSEVETGRASNAASSCGLPEWPGQPIYLPLVFLVCLYISLSSFRISLLAGSWLSISLSCYE